MRWVVGIVVAAAVFGATAAPASAGKSAVGAAFTSDSSNVSEASTQVSVGVRRADGRALKVGVAAVGGTASGGSGCATGIDYVLTPLTGSTVNLKQTKTTSVVLALCPDDADEADESIVLQLSEVVGKRVVAGPQTTVTIVDDDEAASCVDDAVSDDSPGTAVAMGLQPFQRVSCPGNTDWFSLPTTLATLTLTKSSYDVRVWMLDANLDALGVLDWDQASVSVFPPPGQGPRYLRVELVRGTGGPYTLQANYSLYLPTTG